MSRLKFLAIIPLVILVASQAIPLSAQTSPPGVDPFGGVGTTQVDPFGGAGIESAGVSPTLKNNPTAPDITTDCEGGWLPIPTGAGFACWLLYMVNELVDFLAFLPRWIIDSLLILTISLNSADTIVNNPGVRLGWEITRDFANLFFIIVLVAIALGTIFDVGQFNKKLIGKVILVALTINFSLALLQFVVSQANHLALFFMNQTSVIHKSNGGNGDFTSALRDIVNFDQAIKAVTGELQKTNLKTGDGGEAAKEELKKLKWSFLRGQLGDVTGLERNLTGPGGGPDAYWLTMADCENPSSRFAGTQVCNIARANIATAAAQGLPIYSKLALQIMVKIIVIPVGLFILLAASFMLIGRILILSLLAVFAPLAFFSMIVPGYDRFGEWWKKVLNQALFFPAFMFMFMISLILFQEMNRVNANFKETMISYFIGISLMGMSVTVAQSMGAQGASAIIKFGQATKKNITNYAKSRAIQGAGAVTGGGLKVMSETGVLNNKFGRIATAPLRLGLEKVTVQGKKASDEIEKQRVARITQAVEANAESGAKVFRTFRESDRTEFIKGAKDKQLQALSEHLSKEELRKMYETAKDEKVKNKVIANIKENKAEGPGTFDRKVYVQTGKEKPEAAANDQEKLKYQQAVTQVVATMPDQQLRDISKKELNEVHELRNAVEQLASERRVARHLANTEEKAEEFSDMVIKAAGLDLQDYKRKLQDPNRDLQTMGQAIIDGLHRQAVSEKKEHLHRLAERIKEDGNYRNAIFNYVPMSSRFVEIPQAPAQAQAQAAGGGGQGGQGGGAPI